jgi:hypothetical protein
MAMDVRQTKNIPQHDELLQFLSAFGMREETRKRAIGLQETGSGRTSSPESSHHVAGSSARESK